MTKVLICDPLSMQTLEIFEEQGIEAVHEYDLSELKIKDAISSYEGLVVRSRTKVTATILSEAKRLRVIGRAGVGVDNIDVAAAGRNGIVVMNSPDATSVTTAEHTIAMMFALARNIPAADRSTHNGNWERSIFMGVQLAGKTLGVVGYGRIGSIVADRARNLGMKVLISDPYMLRQRRSDALHEHVSLDVLLSQSDVVTLHTSLTDETRNLINSSTLSRMRRGVRIVNCARGGLIVEADVAAALDSGHVAGVAIDVFAEEPARQNPLLGRTNVVATPHIAASTVEAQEQAAVQIARQMAEFLITGIARNAITVIS